MKLVGGRSETAGPLVVAPRAAHAAVVKRFAADERERLGKRKSIAIDKIGGAQTLVAPGYGASSLWIDGASIVFGDASAGKAELSAEELARAFAAFAPDQVTPTAWSTTHKKLPVRGEAEWVLFDACAAGAAGDAGRKPAIVVPLTAPEYLVETAKHAASVKLSPSKTTRVTYRLVRLRPLGVAAPVTAGAAGARAAKAVRMVSTSGGPVIVMPEAGLADWHGIWDESGEELADEADYARAQAISGVGMTGVNPKFGDALVIAHPNGVGFHPLDDGRALFLLGAGDDEPEAMVAALRSIRDGAWQKERASWKFETPKLVLFDAGEDGRKVAKDAQRISFELPPGRYAIESVWNHEAVVKLGKKTREVAIGALRLTLRFPKT